MDGKDKDLLNIEQEYCSSGGNLFVLIENKCIVGTIAVKFFSLPKGYVGEIHRFYIYPEYQRRGYGTKLLDFIYCYAKENGASYLRGTTEYCLSNAIALFKKEVPMKYRSAVKAMQKHFSSERFQKMLRIGTFLTFQKN